MNLDVKQILLRVNPVIPVPQRRRKLPASAGAAKTISTFRRQKAALLQKRVVIFRNDLAVHRVLLETIGHFFETIRPIPGKSLAGKYVPCYDFSRVSFA